MGNKLTSTRPFVDEKYTRPQGLYDAKDMGYRKLRRLILNGQLAPCFPGVEECTSDLDECPICFMFYPSLNRSRCCAKAICTECYLQIRSAQFARSMQCPFCKTSSYTVEFRGAKTVEEKGVEQAEEQKVIEAKIRIRQKELYDEAERMRRLGANTQAGQLEDPVEHERSLMIMEPGMSVQAVQGSILGLNRNDGFDLDIEDTMLMEAIWLSIQEQGEPHQEFALAQQSPTLSAVTEKSFLDSNQISTGIAGQMGLTGAVGAVSVLAEGQVMNAESRGADRVGSSSRNLPGSDRTSNANHNEMLTHEFQDLPKDLCSNRASQMDKQDFLWEKWKNGESSQRNAHFGSEELNGWPNVSKGNSFWSVVQREDRDLTFDLGLDQSSSEIAEAGTRFSTSIPSASGLPWESTDNDCETSSSSALATMLPVSFEDQIMLAVALSLADAQAEARRP